MRHVIYSTLVATFALTCALCAPQRTLAQSPDAVAAAPSAPPT